MRGQFFIISSVIIISAVVIVAQYMSGLNQGSIDYTGSYTYIHSVQSALNNTAKASSYNCDKLNYDLLGTENFLKQQLKLKGIFLDVRHEGCPIVKFSFTLMDNKFNYTTSYTYP